MFKRKSLYLVMVLALSMLLLGAVITAFGQSPLPGDGVVTPDSKNSGADTAENTPARLSGLSDAPVYIRSEVGQPWGQATNEAAMDAVFGTGMWDDLRYETVDPSALFSSNRSFVYMEGSDSNADEMEAFLDSNISLIEDWVSQGSCLFLNSAPNEGNGMSYGFGGVTLNYEDSAGSVTAVDPLHPVFNGPFTPVGISFTGTSFAHASVSGGGVSYILSNNVLAEKDWGFGHVVFGGMTTDNFHSPQPEAANLRANIIDYAYCQVALILNKTDSADPVLPGDTFTYTLNIANTTVFTIATNVVVTDVLPSNVTFVSATPSQGTGCANNSGEVVCDLGTVMTQTNAAVNIVVIAPGVEGVITNTAILSSDEFPLKTDTETTLIAMFTDVAIGKTDSVDPVSFGEVFTYTITVTNTGPMVASGVVITDFLPGGLTNVVAIPDTGTCQYNEGYQLYGLVEQTDIVPLYAINPMSGGGTLVGLTGLDRASAMDMASDGTLYATGTPFTGGPLNVPENHQNPYLYIIDQTTAITTQVGITRTGANVITDISFDPNDTLYAFDNSEVISTVGTIDLGSALFTTVVTPTLSGSGGNGLAFSQANGLLYHANDTNLHVISPTAGTVDVIPLIYPAGVFEGGGGGSSRFNALDFDPVSGKLFGSVVDGNSTYLATVNTTTGVVTYIGETVYGLDAIAFDNELSLLSVSCDLGSLEVGETVNIRLQVTAPSANVTLVNKATVHIDNYDPNTDNNWALEETKVTTVANLSLTKTDNPDPVLAGGVLTYTLLIQNSGPFTATGVRVMDSLPLEVGFVSATTPGGYCSLGTETMYGLVEQTDNIPLYLINSLTGEATLVGNTGLDRSSALDIASDGTLYATGTPGGGAPLIPENHQNPYLYTIDATTAITTQVGLTRTGANVITDISFDPSDTLYAFNNDITSTIGTIDLISGTFTTLITPTLTGNGGNGLAYSPVDGLLYHANDTNLTIIDPVSGTVNVIPLIFPISAIEGGGGARFSALDFDPISGELYGVLFDWGVPPIEGGGGPLTTHLATIDTTTGEVTIIGETVSGLDAIAFMPGTSSTVICNLDDMADGDTITVTVVVTAPLTETVITNTATVSAHQDDQNLADNTDVETTTVVLSIEVDVKLYLPLIFKQ